MEELVLENFPIIDGNVDDKLIESIKFFIKSTSLKEVPVSKKILMDKVQIEKLFSALGAIDIMVYDGGVAGYNLLKLNDIEADKVGESLQVAKKYGGKIFATDSFVPSDSRESRPISAIIQRSRYTSYFTKKVRKAEMKIGGSLSQLEKCLLVYSYISDFVGKEKARGEHREWMPETLRGLKHNTADLTKIYVEACQNLGVPAVQQSFKLIYPDKNTGKQASKNKAVAALLINDYKYGLNGIFYSNIENSFFNRKAGQLCNFLICLEDFININCYGGSKYDMTCNNLDELAARSKTVQEFGFREPLTDEKIVSMFDEDNEFKVRLAKLITNLRDAAYDMKSKDKSVEHYLHAYYGEGKLEPNEKFNAHYQSIFEELFKRNCKELTKARLDENPSAQKFSGAIAKAMKSEDEPEKMESLAQKLKILSENYRGVTPATFTNALTEGLMNENLLAAKDSSAFSKALFEEYKKMVTTNAIVNDACIFDAVAKDCSDYLSYEDLIEMLKFVLYASGNEQNIVDRIVKSVKFADEFFVGTKWNFEYLKNHTNNTFYRFANQSEQKDSKNQE